MIILKNEYEKSIKQEFILRPNVIIKRIKLKKHQKSMDIALANCLINLAKSQLYLNF